MLIYWRLVPRMTSKGFHFRTNSELTEKWLLSQQDKTKAINEILNQYVKGDLVYKENNKVSDEKKRLINLKLNLEVWKMLKDAGYTLTEAQQVMTGDQMLEVPELPYMKKQFDTNNICSFCHHEHTTTEPRVCKEMNCTCGLR